MKNTSKTIIFFGTDNFSLVTLQSLISSGYNIGAVVTQPDSKSGRGQILKAPSVKKLAQEHNITVWQPNKVSDIEKNVVALNKDVIGVLVSFGKIIPQSTISLFNPGIINVHPSLLPKYRGPTPIESAIENGDQQTGVSIMQLNSKMDAGPIYKQTTYKLSGDETSPELYNELATIGAQTLIESLPSIADGSLQPVKQDDNNATYCNLLKKEDSWLKPNEVTATIAECLVRAHLIFPKTKISIIGKDIIITKSHVSMQQQAPTDILCKDGQYLSIDELIAPSGRKMSAKDFLNGCSSN